MTPGKGELLVSMRPGDKSGKPWIVETDRIKHLAVAVLIDGAHGITVTQAEGGRVRGGWLMFDARRTELTLRPDGVAVLKARDLPGSDDPRSARPDPPA